MNALVALALLKNAFGVEIGRRMIVAENYCCADQCIGHLQLAGNALTFSGQHQL
jgi:hypothetical protein